MIAITISSTLLAATMSALDTSFKSYKLTTESASINVATRLTMHRVTTLIRNAEEFGPYPSNAIVTPQITSNWIEFRTLIQPNSDPSLVITQIWKISREIQSGTLGPYRIDAEVTTYQGTTLLSGPITQTVMYRVKDLEFLLEYDVGPRLVRATIDLTVGARQDQVDTIATDLAARQIRMVSTVRPRRLQ